MSSVGETAFAAGPTAYQQSVTVEEKPYHTRYILLHSEYCKWVVEDSSLISLPAVPLGRSKLLDLSKFHRHLWLCTTDY